MLGSLRTQRSLLLAVLLVFGTTTLSQAGLPNFFGGSSGGSTGGSSGGFWHGSSGGSSGLFGGSSGLFHFGSHGSSGGSSGSSGGSFGGSSGVVMGAGPVHDGYLVPTGMSQGYLPMAPQMGQGPLLSLAGTSMPSMGDGFASGQLASVTDDGVQGTLGRTYQLPSKRVNSTTHPRVGLLEITVSDGTFRSLAAGEEVKVTVEDEAGHFDELEGFFGEDDVWHFESEPLYPGIPHIYDVKFEVVRADKKTVRKGDKLIEWEVEKRVRGLGLRRLRLIPGRTVYVSFP